MRIQLETDELTEKIIGCGINVHRALGPGLTENIYERCLVLELEKAGLAVERQRPLTVRYGGLVFQDAYRLDLIVNDTVVVELKSVETILPIHRAQLQTYLRLVDKNLGLLMNFNVEVLRQGVARVVQNFPKV